MHISNQQDKKRNARDKWRESRSNNVWFTEYNRWIAKGNNYTINCLFFRNIWSTLIAVLIIAPYRCVSGGVHMKTHIGCIIYTLILYSGSALLGKYVVLTGITKYISAVTVWIFCMTMIKLYAPADTENVPILRKKERKQKKIVSYIILTVEMISAFFIGDTVISGIIIFGDFIQTVTITRFAFKITDNKYGHEVYANNT